MIVEDRIKRAHIAVMGHKKFCAYSGILACGKVEVLDTGITACTDGWNVAYGRKFVEEHCPTDQELRFLVLHEATHKAYKHLQVWRKLHDTDAKLANIAADHFVNLALEDTSAGDGFIRMPKVGIKPDAKYRGWSVQMIFDDLTKNPPPPPPDQPKGPGGEGEDGDDKGGGLDDHDWDGPPDEQGGGTEERGKEIERAIRQGEMLRKRMAGKGGGNQDGAFGDLLKPSVDWRKALREFVQETCAGRDESSWRKPNRRYLADDIYMPSMVGVTMTELVVGFDTSGSIFGSSDMTRFVSEITSIIEDVKPSKIHVIYWDTGIVGHQTFEDGQFAVQNLKPRGGGGTDGSVLFDYLREKRLTPQAIVQLTDGYVGDWGRSDVPTLWAITTPRISAPWGTTLHLGD
jgi:predicted metal-dependent peptidase